jgi:hypothetical protein
VGPARFEQLGRAQDEQRRGAVPDLEGSDAQHESPQWPAEYGPDAQADRLSVQVASGLRVTDGVDDCERGEQSRGACQMLCVRGHF